MLFFHLYKNIFYFLCFPIYSNVYPKYYQAIKVMSINEIKHFIFENYFKRVGFSKEINYYSIKRLENKDLLLLANKLIKNIPDPRSV